MTALRKVSVAVLSWNGRHHLETCLAALAAQQDPGVDWEVLVLDNGSTDGTAAWMRERWGRDPRVRLIASPVNLGFCAGNNRLMSEASGDAVALLNNDTRPEPGWLGSLVEALGAAPPDVAAVSGKIVDWEGERLDFGRGVMTFDGHAFQLDFRRPLSTARLPAAGEEILFACGGNMLVRRASFLAAAGFDESYFAYLEDVDLGWRLWSGGERILFAPGAVVHHRSGATSDLLGLYNRGFLFERNAFLTAYKNYERGLWERVMPAVMLTLTSRTQALLESNPGAHLLRVDPYAGHIANTATNRAGNGPAPVELPSAATWEGFKIRWRGYGPREFLRRGLRKLGVGSASLSTETPRLTDDRTIAQLRALHWLLGNLEGAAAARAGVQRRRKRSDRDIFERFPLYLVPTYPGDHALFHSPGFQVWLPEDLPLVKSTLAEVMEMG
ncbi:MAG TPA: glycosyltransferase family 2 protein [Thermoanaerobaculia bacterium]|nr:glycosyltransferase family 2 protein [Thermoanaerobaculia bacterium]